ncbi:hypothetical protein P154DRAFT_539092 [Amniculicola lignicola CBS 123094]|uniref:RING-type domain-containing protein n=1 Tax=Amniculicola lignicola CBS 123094 TaxID=1392246 RepID=A0A6A5W798_9PLEO|nr:hypothetical protein P154DRAFT_539092 [Amniculicola lignicola CBS 123094]
MNGEQVEYARKYWLCAIQINYLILMLQFWCEAELFGEAKALHDFCVGLFSNIQCHIHEVPSRWRNNRFILNVDDRKEPPDCMACEETSEFCNPQFAQQAFMLIRQSVDDGAGVGFSLKKIWLLWVQSAKSHDIEALSYTISGISKAMNLVGGGSRMYSWQYGSLGIENGDLMLQILDWFESGIATNFLWDMDVEIPTRRLHEWIVPVESAAELTDEDCSICCNAFTFADGSDTITGTQVIPIVQIQGKYLRKYNAPSKILFSDIFCSSRPQSLQHTIMDPSEPLSNTEQANTLVRVTSRPATPTFQGETVPPNDTVEPADIQLPIDDTDLLEPDRRGEYRARAMQVGYVAAMLKFRRGKSLDVQVSLLDESQHLFLDNLRLHAEYLLFSGLDLCCWRKNYQNDNTTEWVYPPLGCRACDDTCHTFGEEAYQCVRESVDDSISVLETMKALWNLWVNIDKLGPCEERELAVKDKWGSMAGAEKTSYMATFDLDLNTIKQWSSEIATRMIEDPAVRLSRSYFDRIFHDWGNAMVQGRGILEVGCHPWMFGDLGHENLHIYGLLREWYVDFLAQKFRSLQDRNYNYKVAPNWVESPESSEDLAEVRCPICYEDWGEKDAQPVKTRCNHLLCSSCYSGYIHDRMKVAGEDNPRCPTCRQDLQSGESQHRFHDHSWTEFFYGLVSDDIGYGYLEGTHVSPHQFAGRAVEELGQYLEGLEYERIVPELDAELHSITKYRDAVLGSTSVALQLASSLFPDTNDSGAEEETYERLEQKIVGLQIEGLYIARDRLAAFVVGDTEAYQRACLLERQLYAERLALKFLADLFYFCWSHDPWDDSDSEEEEPEAPEDAEIIPEETEGAPDVVELNIDSLTMDGVPPTEEMEDTQSVNSASSSQSMGWQGIEVEDEDTIKLRDLFVSIVGAWRHADQEARRSYRATLIPDR